MGFKAWGLGLRIRTDIGQLRDECQGAPIIYTKV